MEQYLRRNRLSEVLDTLGMAALLYALAVGWFVWLWGLSLPSMAAGGALGTLLWMARGQWRRRNVHRREKALRSRIGGELMLESMLLRLWTAREMCMLSVRLLSCRRRKSR